MLTTGITFQGVRSSLFSFNTGRGEGGFADLDFFHLRELAPHGIMRFIAYGRAIDLFAQASAPLNLSL